MTDIELSNLIWCSMWFLLGFAYGYDRSNR